MDAKYKLASKNPHSFGCFDLLHFHTCVHYHHHYDHQGHEDDHDNDDDDDDGDDDDLVSAEGGEETRGGTAIAFQPAALKDCHHGHDYHYNDNFEDFKCDDYEQCDY